MSDRTLANEPDVHDDASDRGLLGQLGVKGMVKEYMIPVETNSIWYTLGGVLAISLVLEMLTGMLLATRYIPDSTKAYGITAGLLKEAGWSVVLNFHYWNAYFIFALVMVHMMRVFVSAGYRGRRKGLWFVGSALAGVVFLLSITGETLHWDERGFAVPWHMSEILQAIGLDSSWKYTHPDLKDPARATQLLQPYYVAHIAILPLMLLVLMAMHYYLVKIKKVSIPFWIKPSGQKVAFSTHVREWLIYGGIATALLIGLSMLSRDPGPAPQLLSSSQFYGSAHGPGTLGIVPTFPISWTHGLNRFVAIAFGFEPDIWGTVIGLGLMALALLLVPFLDRESADPVGATQAFDMRKRGLAFLAMAIFWLVFVVGVVTNIVTPIG